MSAGIVFRRRVEHATRVPWPATRRAVRASAPCSDSVTVANRDALSRSLRRVAAKRTRVACSTRRARA
jgi:hypothetical protein